MIFFYLKLFMRILSSHSEIQSSTLCDLLQNKIMKVVKEFDVSKQKGESYPDYPDQRVKKNWRASSESLNHPHHII